jgi:hypothetical protein
VVDMAKTNSNLILGSRPKQLNRLGIQRQ